MNSKEYHIKRKFESKKNKNGKIGIRVVKHVT